MKVKFIFYREGQIIINKTHFAHKDKTEAYIPTATCSLRMGCPGEASFSINALALQ